MNPKYPTSTAEAKKGWDDDNQKKKDYIKTIRGAIKDGGAKNSEILSGRARLIALAVLGTCWALLAGKISDLTEESAHALGAVRLFWPMVLSVAALLFDLLQYVLYHFSIGYSLRHMRAFSLDELNSLYDNLQQNEDWKPSESEMLNAFAQAMFWIKILCSTSGASVFIAVVLSAFYFQ
jgi:hypothetical protein